MNIIDYVIIALLIIALIRGFFRGAIAIILDILSLIVSIAGAFFLVPVFIPLVERFSNLPDQFSRVIAFLAGYLVIHAILSIFNWLILKLTVNVEHSLSNRLVGIATSFIYNLLVIGIFLVLIVNIPLKKEHRALIDNSVLTPKILSFLRPVQLPIEKALQTAIQQVSQVVTINKSHDRLSLYLEPKQLSVNTGDEQTMLNLVNQERTKQGLKPLDMDEKLREVARSHAQDMWRRKYFSHINPDGQDPFDRLKAANIQFITGGENLALAPTIEMAHAGLMNSPGHRANILETTFGQVGIGVIDGAPFGEMVVQLFTD